MDVQEIGARLYGIIKQNKRKIGKVQKDAGVGNNYLWRLRTGDIEAPTLDNLRSVVHAAGGDWEEIRPLFEGVDLEPAINAGLATAIADEPVEEEYQRVLDIYARLSHQPRVLAHWLRFGEGLADGIDDIS